MFFHPFSCSRVSAFNEVWTWCLFENDFPCYTYTPEMILSSDDLEGLLRSWKLSIELQFLHWRQVSLERDFLVEVLPLDFLRSWLSWTSIVKFEWAYLTVKVLLTCKPRENLLGFRILGLRNPGGNCICSQAESIMGKLGDALLQSFFFFFLLSFFHSAYFVSHGPQSERDPPLCWAPGTQASPLASTS